MCVTMVQKSFLHQNNTLLRTSRTLIRQAVSLDNMLFQAPFFLEKRLSLSRFLADHLPSLKLTASSHLKMDGWKSWVSFWGNLKALASGAFAVSFRECIDVPKPMHLEDISTACAFFNTRSSPKKKGQTWPTGETMSQLSRRHTRAGIRDVNLKNKISKFSPIHFCRVTSEAQKIKSLIYIM